MGRPLYPCLMKYTNKNPIFLECIASDRLGHRMASGDPLARYTERAAQAEAAIELLSKVNIDSLVAL